MNKSIYIIIAVSVVLLVITGCVSGDEKSETSEAYPSSPSQGDSVTPAYVEPYPFAYPTFEPHPFKTSEPGTVTVHGTLMIYYPEFSRPIDDGLFLVPLQDGGSTTEGITEIIIGETPQAEIDERTGEFYFTNIKPGLYALQVLTTGTAQVPVYNLNDDTNVILEIKNEDIDTFIELGYVKLL